MKRIIQMLAILSLSFIVTSCQDPIIIDGGNADGYNNKTNNTLDRIALICSLTKVDANYYGGWDGNCPGTDVDANIFAGFCKDNGIQYIKLENNECKIDNVVKNWKNCISKLNPDNGLFIFFYSGHGGQVYSEEGEEDGLDETLCFWDGQFRDDNVWKLLNMQPKTTRCFMVTDCCNSQTNFRLPYNLGKTLKKARGKEPNLVHFGGCEDGASSYGSNMGGVFTAALKKYYNKDITYQQWFSQSQKYLKNSSQTPTLATTGDDFLNTKIFK